MHAPRPSLHSPATTRSSQQQRQPGRHHCNAPATAAAQHSAGRVTMRQGGQARPRAQRVRVCALCKCRKHHQRTRARTRRARACRRICLASALQCSSCGAVCSRRAARERRRQQPGAHTAARHRARAAVLTGQPHLPLNSSTPASASEPVTFGRLRANAHSSSMRDCTATCCRPCPASVARTWTAAPGPARMHDTSAAGLRACRPLQSVRLPA